MAAGERTDVELVSRAQAGERAAFEALVERHADRLYAVVLRLSGDPHEAEEATQEAFLRAWRNIARFEGRSEFFTWLYRIGVNEANRRLARRPAAGSEASLEDSAIELHDPRQAPARQAEQRDLLRGLERAIAALPPDHRLPLILRDVEGLSTTEAAAVLELEEAAFKSRLHRARMAVREAVADLVEGGEER